MASQFSLQRLVRVIESVGGAEMRQRLSQTLGRTALDLIRQEIDRSVDCYGNLMPMRAGDGAAPLRGLKNAFTATFTSDGLKVGTSKWYAMIHNVGWTIRPRVAPALRFRLPGGQWIATREVRIPKRQLVPSVAMGLGPVWGPAFRDKAFQFVRDNLRLRSGYIRSA